MSLVYFVTYVTRLYQSELFLFYAKTREDRKEREKRGAVAVRSDESVASDVRRDITVSPPGGYAPGRELVCLSTCQR
jgi:hypothetical protein